MRQTRGVSCASPASGARARPTVRITASLISRILPGSLADRHEAHQHGAHVRRLQRDEEQAAEAVSHCVAELRGLPLGVVAGQP
jgi:hypothetical protein